MIITGFKCNTCHAAFEGYMATNPEETVPDIKCSYCGSTDVEQSDKANEMFELLRNRGSACGG